MPLRQLHRRTHNQGLREFVSHKLRGFVSNKLRGTLTESLPLLPIPAATSSGRAAQSAPLSLASGRSEFEYCLVCPERVVDCAPLSPLSLRSGGSPLCSSPQIPALPAFFRELTELPILLHALHTRAKILICKVKEVKNSLRKNHVNPSIFLQAR
jgi:hypothetical protein